MPVRCMAERGGSQWAGAGPVATSANRRSLISVWIDIAAIAAPMLAAGLLGAGLRAPLPRAALPGLFALMVVGVSFAYVAAAHRHVLAGVAGALGAVAALAALALAICARDAELATAGGPHAARLLDGLPSCRTSAGARSSATCGRTSPRTAPATGTPRTRPEPPALQNPLERSTPFKVGCARPANAGVQMRMKGGRRIRRPGRGGHGSCGEREVGCAGVLAPAAGLRLHARAAVRVGLPRLGGLPAGALRRARASRAQRARRARPRSRAAHQLALRADPVPPHGARRAGARRVPRATRPARGAARVLRARGADRGVERLRRGPRPARPAGAPRDRAPRRAASAAPSERLDQLGDWLFVKDQQHQLQGRLSWIQDAREAALDLAALEGGR